MGAIEYSTRIGEAEMRLTPAAQAKFAELLKQADSDIIGIRVFVTGGGCSGMTYDMTYATSVDSAYDSVLEGPGFKVVVDPVALNYLQGSEIDFTNSSFTDSVLEITGKSQCVGGNLAFPSLLDANHESLLIEPRVGLFVAFPSNPIFLHQVHVVLEGYRFAVVDWHSATFKDPRLLA